MREEETRKGKHVPEQQGQEVINFFKQSNSLPLPIQSLPQGL